MKFVDLTELQNSRRRHQASGNGSSGNHYPCFDTPGKVMHLLRSMLTCSCGPGGKSCGLHCASPWDSFGCEDPESCRDMHDSNGFVGRQSSRTDFAASEQTVAVFVKGPEVEESDVHRQDKDGDFWDELEHRELCELLNFRTGDAAPSYYLYSSVELCGGTGGAVGIPESDSDNANNNYGVSPITDLMEELEMGGSKVEVDGNVSTASLFLLVYRRLPPRGVLTRHRPRNCKSADAFSSMTNGEFRKFKGCLWETFFQEPPSNELTQPSTSEPLVMHRLVSPPYLLHTEEWPGLLDTLLRNIDVIREESRQIPQWAAWPERNHYDSCGQNVDDGDGTGSDPTIYPALWTVFPLCHTFPATDVSQRKFIERTCSFVPQTTALLRGLGLPLRTALFSRLDRRTTLGTHTGWADLANHVLRVHIPLIVPGEGGVDDTNNGLCGTWVDGCVDTHDEGRVVCFDDSKNHRAFNYSDRERVVLIIDLERGLGPMPLPAGTATGGHTDELDAFIKELS